MKIDKKRNHSFTFLKAVLVLKHLVNSRCLKFQEKVKNRSTERVSFTGGVKRGKYSCMGRTKSELTVQVEREEHRYYRK